MKLVLIVDDEPAVLSALQRALKQRFKERLSVETQSDPHLALARVKDTPFDIVMSDLRMPHMDGISLLTLVSALRPRSVRILLTASSDFETAQRAINEAGLFRYLTKPWSSAELASHLEAAIAESGVLQAAALSPQEVEMRRLEAMEPGLTRVEWGLQGEVLMPPLEPRRGGE